MWLRKFKKGDKEEQYFSGMLTDLHADIPVVAFINKNKGESKNAPDFILFRSEPKQEDTGGGGSVPVVTVDDPVTSAPASDEINVADLPY